MPLVAFLRLVHLGIALAVRILRRTRRFDDRCIHDAAALEQQALACKIGIHPAQDLRRQFVFLQQVPEVEDRRLVRDRPRKRQMRKRAYRGIFVEGLFHRRVGQTEPVLHQVDAQHRLQRIRMTAAPGNRIQRLNQIQQRLPGNHLLHLGQEYLPTRLLALARVLRVSEAHLTHRCLPFQRIEFMTTVHATCSDFP